MSASGTQSSYHPARPDKRRRNRGVVIALSVVAVAFGAFLAAGLLTSSGTTQVRLGDNEFKVGRIGPLADRIERDGPLLFQDLLIGGSRDIYVNHVGSVDEIGWVAFDARVPGSDRSCTLVWNGAQQVFADPCTKATIPADGGDLPHYPTRVDDGVLIVDLTPGGNPGQGTSTTGATTTVLVTGRLTTTTAG